MERVASMAKAAMHKARLYCSSIGYFRLMGPSMRPTFNDFNMVLAERISILRGKVGRGDVVMFISPDPSRKFLTKRIKAVGDDVVSYGPPNNRRRGYTDLKKTLVVPNGHVWVEGIICSTVEIPGISVQFLACIYAIEYSLWCGHLEIAD